MPSASYIRRKCFYFLYRSSLGVFLFGVESKPIIYVVVIGFVCCINHFFWARSLRLSFLLDFLVRVFKAGSTKLYCTYINFVNNIYLLIMVIMLIPTKKAGKDFSGNWVHRSILGSTFAFVREGVFDQVMTNVDPATNWGCLPIWR